MQTRLCALPLACVRETLRPLPVEPLAAPVDHVLGVALIRGLSVPVLDLATLLGLPAVPARRFVVIAVGERRVALAVTEVLGLHPIAGAAADALPPLMREVRNALIESIGWLDADLLLVLDGARLLPEGLDLAAGAEAVA